MKKITLLLLALLILPVQSFAAEKYLRVDDYIPPLPQSSSGSGDMTKAVYDVANDGSADTANALKANGANCAAGQYPLGVDASGAVETCTAAYLAVGVVSHTAATVVLTTAQCQDGYHYNGDDDVIDFTLPAVAVGLSCCFDANLYARVITVDPAGSNVLILDGVALTAGNAVDTGGAVTEKFCVVGRDATNWTVINGTAALVDGGAD